MRQQKSYTKDKNKTKSLINLLDLEPNHGGGAFFRHPIYVYLKKNI